MFSSSVPTIIVWKSTLLQFFYPLFSFFFFSRFAYIEIAECLVGNSVEYAPTLCETRGNCPSKAQIFLLQSWQGEEFEETFFPENKQFCVLKDEDLVYYFLLLLSRMYIEKMFYTKFYAMYFL